MCPKWRPLVALAVLSTHWLWADGNSWNKVRYVGGTVAAKVNPYDWNTTLTLTPDTISLMFAHRTTLKLAASQVTGLSYGQEALRRNSVYRPEFVFPGTRDTLARD